MSNPQHNVLARSMDHFAWYLFAAAVRAVYRENKARYESGQSPFKQNSDCWAWDGDLSDELDRRTREHWCKIAKRDHTFYPYSTNGVRRMYFRFRKRNKEELAAFDQEIDNALRGWTPGENQGTMFDE